MKIRNIYLASDHAGFKLKKIIGKFLIKNGNKVMDLGPKNSNSVDYPYYAHLLSRKMKRHKESFGILICGSGIGMDITANKHKNIRAALCYNIKSASLSRKHNNANVMAMGSRLITKKLALKCVKTFFKTSFEGGRHQRRVRKI